MLTPIRDVIFEYLDKKVFYNTKERTAIVYYVCYRTIERRPSGGANGRFFRVTQNLEGLFSEYCTTVFNKHFE